MCKRGIVENVFFLFIVFIQVFINSQVFSIDIPIIYTKNFVLSFSIDVVRDSFYWVLILLSK